LQNVTASFHYDPPSQSLNISGEQRIVSSSNYP